MCYSSPYKCHYCVHIGSCSAGVGQPVYHPLPTSAPPRSRESALAQLMHCEQRILHSHPRMPHFREMPPAGHWPGPRHAPPPSQPFLPIRHHHEELWHIREGTLSIFQYVSFLRLDLVYVCRVFKTSRRPPEFRRLLEIISLVTLVTAISSRQTSSTCRSHLLFHLLTPASKHFEIPAMSCPVSTSSAEHCHH